MPCAFQVSRKTRRACLRAEGLVNLRGCLEAGYRLSRDERLRDDFQVLADMRGSSWRLSHDEAMDLANAVAQLPPHGGRVAVLVASSVLEPARAFCALAGVRGLQVEPFDCIEEARAWLAGPSCH